MPHEVETRSAPFGSTVVLDCQTNLEAPVQYFWSKQDDVLPSGTLQGRGGTLTIPNIKTQDVGTYICTARNQFATIEIPTNLVVSGVVSYFSQVNLIFVSGTQICVFGNLI